ncbi:M20/M25/M40 family metallo-hydrolase [Nocardia sp. NPDC004340]
MALAPYRPLYVIKIGGASLRAGEVWSQLAELTATGARILVIAGGSADITDHYTEIGRTPPLLTMVGGQRVRDARPAEMPHIVASYRSRTLPRVVSAAAAAGVTVTALLAGDRGLVRGLPNRPMKIVAGERIRVTREQLAGTVCEVDVDALGDLLATSDAVCLTAPIAGRDGGWLNIDADVLAASLSNALGADHLRIVTSTGGLLSDVGDPGSVIADICSGQGYRYAQGRMRQKIRAVELAQDGPADIAITGVHWLRPTAGTRCWRAGDCDADLRLLSRMVDISSVSGDEAELACYLREWARARGLSADLDAAGNLVVTIGDGPFTVLLLGHLDTVPFRWTPSWQDGILSGRGSVDAKGCLAVFLETAAAAQVPPGVRLLVVGAVQEETTSAGAFHIRDQHRADVVIIGEPSGAAALTIGYNGLLKAALRFRAEGAHPAGEGTVTAADGLLAALTRLREAVLARAPHALVATLDIGAGEHAGGQSGSAVVDVRVPPDVELGELVEAVRSVASAQVSVEILRATPGVRTARDNELVRSFATAFRSVGVRPRYVFKRGSSDMNTLATGWPELIAVAYGPGDAAYDHRPDEQLPAESFRDARAVLDATLTRLFERAATMEGSAAQ